MEREERLRKLYIISKALYLGIKQLSQEIDDEQTQADLQDMQKLYNEVYVSYIPVQGEEQIQRPITVRRTLWNVN